MRFHPPPHQIFISMRLTIARVLKNRFHERKHIISVELIGLEAFLIVRLQTVEHLFDIFLCNELRSQQNPSVN